MNLRVKFVLSIVLPGLLCLMLPGSIRADTVNINSINANNSPFFVDISTTNLLAQYGITLANVTPGTTVAVLCGECGGNSIVPSSPPNTLTQFGNDNGMSYTLQFSTPLSTLSFNLAGNSKSGGSGTVVAAWSATAFNASGAVVSSVGDPSLFSTFSPFSPQPFTLTGPGIASVTFFTQCFNFCGTVLNIADLSAPEIKIVSSLTLSLLSGDGQADPPLTALSKALVVKVTDQSGSAVPGVPISFAITQQPSGANGASLDSSAVTTSSDGTASVQLTLGDTLGRYQVTASCTGCVPNTLVFSETAGGECTTNVTRESQGDPRWASNLYDHSSTLTIQNKGCALTSLSMALNIAGASNDPGTLNQTMASTDTDYSGLGVNWGPATRDASGGTLKFHSQRIDSTVDLQGAQNYLDNVVCQQHHPVIVGVNLNDQGTPRHFVIVTGKKNGDYQIADPGFSRTALSDYDNEFVTRGFVADPPGDISELNLAVGDVAETLVIDSAGRKTGFDPASGQVVEQIPNSTYFRDSLQDDVTGAPATETTHLTEIFQPAQGGYQIVVTGLKLGTYSLSSRMFSQDGRSQPDVLITSIAGPGSASSFAVQVASTPGSASEVVVIATFASTLGDITNSLQLGLIDNHGIANSLSKKIQHAQDATGPDRTNILNAFINEVSAQAGKHISGLAAQVLLADANSLLKL